MIEPEVSVLVLDGEQRAALAVTRSLVRAGYRVHVGAGSRWAPAALSRGARFVPVEGDPLHAPAAYAASVASTAVRTGCSVVIPVTDASIEAVLECRGAFPSMTCIPFAPLSVYRAASDKVHVQHLATEVGIGIAESRIVTGPTDEAPNDARLYPGVVKPHRSVVGGQSRVATGVQLVRDREQCAAVLRALPSEAFPVMVQRRVRGPGVGYFALRWNGSTLARFAHRRLRERPPSGGTSVLSEGVLPHPDLQRACDALLDRLDWQGVAMVECKQDLDQGGWRVMEINGRFWGSLQLAVDSGVDFPSLLVSSALGAPAVPVPRWQAGRRLRWEWGDLDHLLLRLLRSRKRLSLLPEAPGRLAVLGAFVLHRPGRDRLELLRVRDPLPFFGEALSRLRRS